MLADLTNRAPRRIVHTSCAGEELGSSKLGAYAVEDYDGVDILAASGDRIVYSTGSPKTIRVVEDPGPRKIAGRANLLAFGGIRFIVRRGSTAQTLRENGSAIRLGGPVPTEARIRGDVIVTVDSDRRLRVLDATSGTVTRTIGLLPSPVDPPRLEDLDAPYVAVVVDGELRIVRLSDGRPSVSISAAASHQFTRASRDKGFL
jgi:hypothetical protein